VLTQYILLVPTLLVHILTFNKVGHHLLHNTDEKPPFKRVILESGAATARAVYTPSHPLHEEQFQEFLKRLHIPPSPKSKILPALRAKTFLEIKAASGAIFEKYNPSVRWPFQPVIDGPGGMIPTAPIAAWKAGTFHRVPILTGFNTNEGSMFVPEHASASKEFTNFFHTLLPSLSKYDLDLLNEVYPDPLLGKDEKYKETRQGLGSQFTRLEQAYGHFAYVAPVLQTASFASSPSKSSSDTKEAPPVYLYEFALPTNATHLAFHGSHSTFITHNPEINRLPPTIKEMSATMHAYWTSFILTGDPNDVKGKLGDRVVWPRFNAEGKREMIVFGEGNSELIGGKEKGDAVKIGSDAGVKEVCKYWMERTELFEI
jgi:acetylcholinesterase